MKTFKIVIAAFVVIAIGAGAFFGGTYFQKNQDSLAGLTGSDLTKKIQALGGKQQPAGLLGQLGANFLGGTRPGGVLGASGSAGKITAKTDKSVTIQLLNGKTRTVNIGDTTSVQKSVVGATHDLTVGQDVTVTGTSNKDGSMNATSILIRVSEKP